MTLHRADVEAARVEIRVAHNRLAHVIRRIDDTDAIRAISAVMDGLERADAALTTTTETKGPDA